MYLPERSISLKPEDDHSQVPQIIVSSPIKGFKGFARLEKSPRSSIEKSVHCSMIINLLLIIVKSPRQFASFEYRYLLYYAILFRISEVNL